MGNVQVICMMGKHLSITIVTNIYASGLRQAINSRNRAESKLKVTKKVIKYKKIKCHNCDPMSNDETPMRLRHLVAEIFAKTHSAKIGNETVVSLKSLSGFSLTCTYSDKKIKVNGLERS